WAVGFDDDPTGLLQSLIEQWDGNSWTVVPYNVGNHWLGSVACPSASECFAVGNNAWAQTVIEAYTTDTTCLTPPVAALAATPTSGNAPLTVDFDATGSYIPPGGCGRI